MWSRRKKKPEPIRHWCDEWFMVTEADAPSWRFSDAIGSIEYNPENKTWYANANNEYATTIRYCPFCGKDLQGSDDVKQREEAT